MEKQKKNYYEPMHTAEHILNKTMVDMFGCQRSNNCHIERKKSKCDFILERAPSENEISEIENNVKKIINQNLDVYEEMADFETAEKKFNLKKINKLENPLIRIIKIGNYDECPCIGQHVSKTGEIGEFKITTTNYNEGIFRIRFKLV